MVVERKNTLTPSYARQVRTVTLEQHVPPTDKNLWNRLKSALQLKEMIDDPDRDQFKTDFGTLDKKTAATLLFYMCREINMLTDKNLAPIIFNPILIVGENLQLSPSQGISEEQYSKIRTAKEAIKRFSDEVNAFRGRKQNIQLSSSDLNNVENTVFEGKKSSKYLSIDDIPSVIQTESAIDCFERDLGDLRESKKNDQSAAVIEAEKVLFETKSITEDPPRFTIGGVTSPAIKAIEAAINEYVSTRDSQSKDQANRPKARSKPLSAVVLQAEAFLQEIQ